MQLEHEIKAFHWKIGGDPISRILNFILYRTWHWEHASRHWTIKGFKLQHCCNNKAYACRSFSRNQFGRKRWQVWLIHITGIQRRSCTLLHPKEEALHCTYARVQKYWIWNGCEQKEGQIPCKIIKWIFFKYCKSIDMYKLIVKIEMLYLWKIVGALHSLKALWWWWCCTNSPNHFCWIIIDNPWMTIVSERYWSDHWKCTCMTDKWWRCCWGMRQGNSPNPTRKREPLRLWWNFVATQWGICQCGNIWRSFELE